MSESSTEDDLLRPAFPLPPISIPSHTLSSTPPTSVEQYLAQVRQQSNALPDVIVSRLNPPVEHSPLHPNLFKLLRLPPTPAYLEPDIHWQQQLVSSFTQLQYAIDNAKLLRPVRTVTIPSRADLQHWHSLIFGDRARGPVLDVVLSLDHVRVVDALRIIDTELSADEFDKIEAGANLRHAALATLKQFVRGRCCDWIFALFALLSLPLSDEPASIIRSMLRKATIARLACVGEENESEEKRTIRLRTDERLARINVLITLMDKRFAQGDRT